ncbi:MAG: hypothetical protein PVF95_06885, partial [bacterium]
EDAESVGLPPDEPWWGAAEDLAAMESFFSDTTVIKVEAEIWVDSPAVSRDKNSSMRCWPYIKVSMQRAGWSEPAMMTVEDTWLYFEFVRDEADTNLWRILKMREELRESVKAKASMATEPVTFGRIKDIFRPRSQCEISPRSTPECLFRAFEQAMNRRDIDAYYACLHDEYLFVFTAPDADDMGLPPLEPWWGLAEEVSAVARLFSDPGITMVKCALHIEAGPWPIENGFFYELDPDITVVIERPGWSEPLVYEVESTWLEVEVVPDPYCPEKWVFERMYEVFKEGPTAAGGSHAGPMVEGSTFGGIKAIYK